MKKKKRRIVCYVRVSHEEQVKYGFSIDAQKEALLAWAEANNCIIVGWYIDEGVSARKKVKNRKQLQAMLRAVQSEQIDLIIFTRLDRYFRSVGEYHLTQAILDENRTDWKAITEDYDTSTPDGRFKINIMLSIAEQEADRTSERIKFTFDHKVKKKQPLFGSQPHGYKVGLTEDGEKCVVKNEDQAEAVQEVFSHFSKYRSISGTTEYMNVSYGYPISYNTIKKMLTNEYYTGCYRGVKDYCPSYITEEQYRENVRIVESKNIPKSRSGNVYLFRGLIICPECGSKLTCQYTQKNGKNYINYRCSKAHKQRLCKNRMMISEKKVEDFLIQNIRSELSKYITEIEVSCPAPKRSVNPEDIKKKMNKLNDLYMMDRIEFDMYDRKYRELEQQLAELSEEEQPVDLSAAKEFLESDLLDLYNTLSPEDKRAAWNLILKEIYVDFNRTFSVKFL